MLSDFYRSVPGGIEVLVRSLALELSERGHEVAIAAIAQEGLSDLELDGPLRVHRLRTSTQRMSRLYTDPDRPAAPPFPDPEAVLSLRRVLDRERPDVVHAHDWLVRSFLPLKRWSGARLAVSLHYYTLACARKDLMFHGQPCEGPAPGKCLGCGVSHYGAARGIPVVLGHLVASAAERRAVDAYLPVSHAVALGNGLPGSGLPFEVIPNFIADPPHDPSPALEEYTTQLPAEPFLLFVGDLGRYKGVGVLVDAWKELDQRPPLVLIGKAAPNEPLDLPPDATLLLDWPHEAVLEAHRRSFAVVVPSLWAEPFGMVVIEAMAAGRPVIASRIGGIPEIVQDGRSGLLAPAGDSHALRGAIAKLLDDREFANRLGQAALERSRSFQALAIVPRFEHVYARLLARAAA
jgi:glycosyltransferase involved in cell wall biosynthesis